jgi:hypothetical protein
MACLWLLSFLALAPMRTGQNMGNISHAQKGIIFPYVEETLFYNVFDLR